jgi:glycosyltransferase involved in cell wall biosynthesis
VTTTEPASEAHSSQANGCAHRVIPSPSHQVSIVVIGRNEGERLRRCFAALGDRIAATVYVDSGSVDESVALARSLGVEVVKLDMSRPFTAARARNAGMERLIELFPDCQFVQFVDGDCELSAGWLESAEDALRGDPSLAAVFGRLSERHPEASIYNRLCEVEWNLAPVGPVDACGGNVMMRLAPVHAAGGFDADLPAGEEGELCLRLRRNGGAICRLGADMATHDANITRWTQWWSRAERFGLAAAEGAIRHGRGNERFHTRTVLKSVLTGGLLPILILALVWPTNGWSLLAFLYYPLTALRVARHVHSPLVPWRAALAFGASLALAKIPQFFGVCRFVMRRLFRRPPRLIEYK